MSAMVLMRLSLLDRRTLAGRRGPPRLGYWGMLASPDW